MKTLRLMTYNVHRCVGTDRKLDVERVAEVIAAEKPDVVALQELDVLRARTKGVDQAHRLAELLKMSFHFHPAMTVEEELYGDAILTALPERRIKAKGLPLYRRVPRAGAPWTPMQARALCHSQTVVALALSGSQRQILEARLSLLGRRLPPSRKLIALSPTVAGWSPAVPRCSFWHSVTFPALPNRASMLHHLQNLAV